MTRDDIWPMKLDRIPKGVNSELGQGLVEFAITLPVLLLLLLGTVDLGMGFKTYIALTHAAREGARWISIYPYVKSNPEVPDCMDAIDRIADQINEVGYTVDFSPYMCNHAPGDEITVTVTHD